MTSEKGWKVRTVPGASNRNHSHTQMLQLAYNREPSACRLEVDLPRSECHSRNRPPRVACIGRRVHIRNRVRSGSHLRNHLLRYGCIPLRMSICCRRRICKFHSLLRLARDIIYGCLSRPTQDRNASLGHSRLRRRAYIRH